MLRHWLQRCWPTSKVARNRLCMQRCLLRRPWPSRLQIYQNIQIMNILTTRLLHLQIYQNIQILNILTTGPPHRTKRWPTRLTSKVATSGPNALQLRRQKRNTTRTMTMLRGELRRTPHPSLLALTSSWPKSEPWMTVLATGLHLVTRSLPRRTMKPQI
jgi:hypothetical protein